MRLPRIITTPAIPFLLALIFCSPQCFSQAGNQYQLSDQAREQLTQVQDLMQRNEFQKALETLNALRNAVRNRRYDLAVTWQTIGYAYTNLGNNKQAIQAFINALDTRALPPDIDHDVEYSVAQLLMADGSYADGMKYLSNWFRRENNPPAEAHYMAATAYYYLKEYKQQIFQARKAISKRDNAPASWYELLLAGYYETNDMVAAADLMETMIKKFPSRNQYWMQLAGVYLNIKRPKQALALMELAYMKGLIRQQQDLMQMAQTYMYLGMPYKAATLISTEMDKKNINKTRETLTTLADSWYLAREPQKAIDVLSGAVAQYQDTGMYYKLAQLYVEREEWDGATKMLNLVINKPDFKNIADAWLLLGVAALHGNDLTTSYRALNNALRYDATRKQAQQWLAELKRK